MKGEEFTGTHAFVYPFSGGIVAVDGEVVVGQSFIHHNLSGTGTIAGRIECCDPVVFVCRQPIHGGLSVERAALVGGREGKRGWLRPRLTCPITSAKHTKKAAPTGDLFVNVSWNFMNARYLRAASFTA